MVFSLRKESNLNVPKNLLCFRRAERHLDETHMLRIDYKPEAEAKVGEKSLKEKYDLIESVIEELVKIEK